MKTAKGVEEIGQRLTSLKDQYSEMKQFEANKAKQERFKRQKTILAEKKAEALKFEKFGGGLPLKKLMTFADIK